MDRSLRELERQAATGDSEAQRRLERSRRRVAPPLDERELLDAIRDAGPREHGPRLSYTSWLEARDPADPRAERIRLEIQFRGRSLQSEPDSNARMSLLEARDRLRELEKLVGAEACEAVPAIVDPCPDCGAELEWNEDHPYQNVYGWVDPTFCPGCGWESE